MEAETRQMMFNSVKLVTSLKPGETITREDLIDALREPLPDDVQSEATLRHAFRHYILRGGIKNADAIVTYEEAAKLAKSTVDALRAAAYRGKLIKLGIMTVQWDGRHRRGITLRSLAEYKRWSLAKFEAAAHQVEKWRAKN